MDYFTDCPICFEEFAEQTEREHRTTPCCGQSLCCHCKECLSRCPFCRTEWDDSGNGWQRPGAPNPIFAVLGQCARNPILTWYGGKLAWALGSRAFSGAVGGISSAAASAAAVAAEASPAAIGGLAGGALVVVGGAALYAASMHQECQSQRLRAFVRGRGRRQLYPAGSSYHSAAAALFQAIHWSLLPQKNGMPHVYHGSPWRNAKRESHITQVRALCAERAPAVAMTTPRDVLWGDLTFCFTLWLEYNPHTANWGACQSYGMPPLHLCWHNRWREDLRHVISDLARSFMRFRGEADFGIKEWSCASCLLVMLDHVLSWHVVTPDRGSSDLLRADMYSYQDFCQKLLQCFALTWALAQAPADADLDSTQLGDVVDIRSHLDVMSGRELPEVFRNIW
eukprot:TRINITY_DN79576_c0_g1_i1.p1 TRINITY_DN79576_c0_g1~~TRINITY_DN79576_c0_g1_i1.p1  ORF type:complete len:396 (+),score=24.79 TRINITY_DN79576_c0_g1_i1:43-1230(+)